jgi:hypothetical protein
MKEQTMNTKNYLTTNFQAARSPEAQEVVAAWHGGLDRRKTKAYGDPEVTKQVLTSLLAYQGTEFNVNLKDLPEGHRDCVKAVLDDLMGTVLERRPGKTCYGLKGNYNASKVQTIISDQDSTVTAGAATYRDGSHTSRVWSEISHIGFFRAELLQLPAINLQFSYLSGDLKCPGLRFKGVEETQESLDRCLVVDQQLEEFDTLVYRQARALGLKVAPYGKGAYITSSCGQLLRVMNMSVVRMFNKSGCQFSAHMTERYDRVQVTYGQAPR